MLKMFLCQDATVENLLNCDPSLKPACYSAHICSVLTVWKCELYNYMLFTLLFIEAPNKVKCLSLLWTEVGNKDVK